jgi:hypothetical protein
MSNSSQIVCGGGWKGTSLARIKVKAWVALFTAIVLARISVTASSSVWMICAAVLAALTFLAAILFFIREKPRDVQFPHRRTGRDPRKLYAVTGTPFHHRHYSHDCITPSVPFRQSEIVLLLVIVLDLPRMLPMS